MTPREQLLDALLAERYSYLPQSKPGLCDDGPTRQYAIHEAMLEAGCVELTAVA